jgi:hypothetical protein
MTTTTPTIQQTTDNSTDAVKNPKTTATLKRPPQPDFKVFKKNLDACTKEIDSLKKQVVSVVLWI